jgi:hypothetical protein
MPEAFEDRTKGQSASQVGSGVMGLATAPTPSPNSALWLTQAIQKLGNPQLQELMKFIPVAPEGAMKPASSVMPDIQALLSKLGGKG